MNTSSTVDSNRPPPGLQYTHGLISVLLLCRFTGMTNPKSSSNHGPKIAWFSDPGVKVSTGLLGAFGVILAIKFRKQLQLDSSSEQIAPPRFWAVPGLQNLGSNCFLNVILQALASSSCFRKYLREMVDEYCSDELGGEELPLVNSLTHLVEELCTIRDRMTVLSPRKVMHAVDHYIPNFNLATQQDAEEALSHLLNSLREEISENFVPNRTNLADLLASSSDRFLKTKSGEENELEKWRRCFLEPFDGILRSILICRSCSFQISLDFQLFHSLHLSPPMTSGGTIIAGCTLEDCLKIFFAAEHIKNYCCSNCWHNSAVEYLSSRDKIDIKKLQNCNNDDSCNCKSLSSLGSFRWSNNFSRAFKQLSMARSPKILCIHLQRASYNMFGESKLLGHISFPSTLDLSPFINTEVGLKNMDSSKPSNNRSRLLKSFLLGYKVNTAEDVSSEEKINANNDILPSGLDLIPKYRLVSVVEHYGSGESGHYTGYRRVIGKIGEDDPSATLLESAVDQWFFISDTHVHSVSERDVLDANASVLFYERVDDS